MLIFPHWIQLGSARSATLTQSLHRGRAVVLFRTTPPPSIQSPAPEPCSFIGQERARDVMRPSLPSLVVPQILIRTKLLDAYHTLCSYSFWVTQPPQRGGPCSFLPSLGWFAPPKSTRAWEPTLLWNQLHQQSGERPCSEALSFRTIQFGEP